MKTQLLESFKQVVADRMVLALFAGLIGLALLLVAYVAVAIEPSDVQIVTHYTAFGPTNFYRDRWFYLLSFAGFSLLLAALHSVIGLKLYREKGRDFTVAFLWLSIGLLLIGFVIAHSILSVASL